MYKFTYEISEYFFRYKTEYPCYNFYAVRGDEKIIIASVKDTPHSHSFLQWLEVAAKVEEKKAPHLTADDVAELIGLFQNYLEEDADAPIYPYIEAFSKIMMSN